MGLLTVKAGVMGGDDGIFGNGLFELVDVSGTTRDDRVRINRGFGCRSRNSRQISSDARLPHVGNAPNHWLRGHPAGDKDSCDEREREQRESDEKAPPRRPLFRAG